MLESMVLPGLGEDIGLLILKSGDLFGIVVAPTESSEPGGLIREYSDKAMWGRLQPGFSLRGTSVSLERLAGTCGRRAEATPQAHLCPHLFPMAYTDEFRGFR